jgi:hypothetical protein
MMDCRYDRSKMKKIFNRSIDNIDENETKSIDRYHRYRSIDPSPIVPIYGKETASLFQARLLLREDEASIIWIVCYHD